jgi:hypothetical protein
MGLHSSRVSDVFIRDASAGSRRAPDPRPLVIRCRSRVFGDGSNGSSSPGRATSAWRQVYSTLQTESSAQADSEKGPEAVIALASSSPCLLTRRANSDAVGTAQAAPIGPAAVAGQNAGPLATPVHCRRYRHCHRRCWWRNGRRQCRSFYHWC